MTVEELLKGYQQKAARRQLVAHLRAAILHAESGKPIFDIIKAIDDAIICLVDLPGSSTE